MSKGKIFFFVGLVMFVGGIYISTFWVSIGSILGVIGGGLMGWSIYFLSENKVNDR